MGGCGWVNGAKLFPCECTSNQSIINLNGESRGRGRVDNSLTYRVFATRLLHNKDLVAYLDGFRGQLGYDIIDADGVKYSSRSRFPPNRCRYLDARISPVTPWFTDIVPLDTPWEPSRHRRVILDPDEVHQALRSIEGLNPELGPLFVKQRMAYGMIFGMKACQKPVVNLPQVLVDFFEARVAPEDRASEEHVLTLNWPLKKLGQRFRAAMAVTRDRARVGEAREWAALVKRQQSDRRQYEKWSEDRERKRLQDHGIRTPPKALPKW